MFKEIKCVLLLLILIGLIIPSSLKDRLYKLSVIHFNDFHARYEPMSIDSGVCKNERCIGGFSRLYATIMNLLNQNPDSIVLNGGDNFEGTLWYDIYKWNVTQHFFNKLPIDAYTLGNHEFEDKIEGLVPFLQHLKSPVLAANIDASREPSLQGLFNKSIVIQRNGLKIGIIGVIWSRTNEINDVGNLVLLDESGSVNAEAKRLVSEENVFTNIVLSHCGYAVDKEIAKNANSKISLIVGAHSHTFLYTGEPVPGYDIPVGPYPTVIQNRQRKMVLVVQASSFSKYLGNLSIYYNSQGDIINWSGAPIFLNSSLPQDTQINEELKVWQTAIDDEREKSEIIGSTLVRLEQSTCPTRECLLGNFITDAMVFGYTKSPESGSWTNGSIAVIHGGGLRAGIDIGNITFSEIFAADPFGNTIDLAEIRGKQLKQVFESSATNTSINLLQVSGIKMVYNLSKPEGERVTSILLRCRKCDVPIYEKMDEEKTYRIILPSFLATGGFGFDLFKQYLKNRQIGNLDTDLFVNYVKHRSPIFQENEGRIQIYT